MWFLAHRHLVSRKKQTFFIILGIVLGTAAYVSISGMMLGFQSFIVDQLVNNDSHVRISAREEPITPEDMRKVLFSDKEIVFWKKPPSGRRDDPFISNPTGWFDKLSKDQEVFSYSEQLQVQVITSNGRITQNGQLVGSWPNKQLAVTNLERYMLKGSFNDISPNSDRVVIGSGLATKLGLTLDDYISAVAGKGSPKTFRVAGIFRLGIKALDDTMMFGHLLDVQKFNRTPSRISSIAIKLQDVTKAKQKSAEWGQWGQDKVQSWEEANEGILSVFKTQDIVRNFMTISIILVASFGIYNILSMAVNNKKKEIAILRSMGFLPSDIKKLFLLQGLTLGTVGGIIGLVIGYGISLYLSTIEVSANRGIGTNKMFIVFFPSIYIFAFVMALGSALIASFLPSRAAGKLGPIEIIRGEGA
jgi:lipoprotein-releasing system permease protein